MISGWLWAVYRYQHHSLVPRLPDLFNVAREKRGSLVKLITCVTSGGTNFHIWHNSKLAKIRARDTESSSSSTCSEGAQASSLADS